MPQKPLPPCKYPLCPQLAEPGKAYCSKHRRVHPSEIFRPSANERGYTKQWHRARTRYLKKHPLCVECLKHGITRVATVVDHIIPASEAPEKFWDESNWQSLCETCHNQKTMRERGD